jgi:hypothetical protein
MFGGNGPAGGRTPRPAALPLSLLSRLGVRAKSVPGLTWSTRCLVAAESGDQLPWARAA